MQIRHMFAFLLVAMALCLTSCSDQKTPENKNGGANPKPEIRPPAEKEITNSIGMKLQWIPPGRYTRGYKHRAGDLMYKVTITRGFFFGVYEVTQEEYQKIAGVNPGAFSSEGAKKDTVPGLDTRRFPVETVSWHDATEFCAKLSDKEKKTYRLPTDAEWEYACRGGAWEFSNFHVGDRLTAKDANISPEGLDEWAKSPKRPVPVGSYPPNAWGLHDMHGNVSEWCMDWYETDHDSMRSSRDDPLNLKPSDKRVIRNGNFGLLPEFCISGYRGRDRPDLRADFLGFRVVLDYPWKEE